MENRLAKRVSGLEEGFEEEFIDSVVIATLMTVMLMFLMPMVSSQVAAASSRVQVLASALDATSQNAGLLWYELTALGQPNRLKMIGENSTGAFEQILVSLST